MTPKEKAKELYWKYYQNISDTSFPEETAKKCALITVDEILEAIDWHNFEVPNDEIWYWQEVKQEIEKL